jgi:hypothetical protein
LLLDFIFGRFSNYQATLPDELMQIKTWEGVFVERPERLGKWDEFPMRVLPLLRLLGPYLGVNCEVGIKFMRLLNIFFNDEKAQAAENCQECKLFLIG